MERVRSRQVLPVNSVPVRLWSTFFFLACADTGHTRAVLSRLRFVEIFSNALSSM